MYDNYTVRLLDLPYTVKAVTAMDEDGYYNIYINSKLSKETQQKAVQHELAHVQMNDFYSSADIRDIETRAGA